MTTAQTVHIRVRSRLSKRVATAFDGMTLVPGNDATELVGEIVDQAQLHGLLTRIRDLGLALESVYVFDAAPAAAEREG